MVTGGHYDIDCTVTDPNKKELYKGMKKEYDTFVFTAEVEGAYQVCFGNEFSTFSHKLVYVDWYVGEEHPFRNPMKKDTVLTQVSHDRYNSPFLLCMLKVHDVPSGRLEFLESCVL